MSTQSAPQLKYYDLFVALFVATLIMSNVLAQKLFTFGPTVFTAGIIIFPVSYILGDILTEVYGYAKTRRVIWFGFAANVLFVILTWIAIALPPAPFWPLQKEFEQVLAQVPRLVTASLIAYLAGEFTNSYVLAKLKLFTDGKYLWTRTVGSTVAGQAVDTSVFVVIAFAGTIPPDALVQVVIWAYLFKVVYEVLATPITYIVVFAVKRAEHLNIFDRQTNFTPFRINPSADLGSNESIP